MAASGESALSAIDARSFMARTCSWVVVVCMCLDHEHVVIFGPLLIHAAELTRTHVLSPVPPWPWNAFSDRMTATTPDTVFDTLSIVS